MWDVSGDWELTDDEVEPFNLEILNRLIPDIYLFVKQMKSLNQVSDIELPYPYDITRAIKAQRLGLEPSHY